MGLPLAALVVGGIGAGVSAMGQIEQGQAQAHAANYNAQVAKNNATYASAAGAQQATTESMKGADVAARAKVGEAANNIDVNNGSALKVQEGNREGSDISTQTTENNALLAAYGYQQEGILQGAEAKQAPVGADVGAAGGLLSSASGLGFKWANLQNTG